jgi:multiple antibiotic resistance protein
MAWITAVPESVPPRFRASIDMMSDLRQFLEWMLLAIAALMPIVNPLGGAPVYLAQTVDLTASQHADLARRVAINCFLLLLASLLVGAYVLEFFGLSIPVVQVAGGLVVCSLGWSMLTQPDEPAPSVKDATRALTQADPGTRAFYPLTMPLTVGPGSISVAITLGANHSRGMRSLVIESLAHTAGIVVVTVSIFLTYRYADRVLKRLGPTGTVVLVRLSAFILLCIGVQIGWNGVSALLRSLGPH